MAILYMSSNQYPWNNTELVAFWYWEGNYSDTKSSTGNYSDTGSSTNVVMTNQGWYLEVSGPQTNPAIDPSANTNLVGTQSGTFTYYGVGETSFVFPSGLNCIIAFPGFSNANLAMGQYYLYNYTMNTNMVKDIYNYFGISDISDASGNYLIGMSFGGGNTATGGWSTGVSMADPADASGNPNIAIGGIYSIYQQCTPTGTSFSYTETGTGYTLDGSGNCSGYTSITQGSDGLDTSTGYFSMTQFNCLVFDIECGTNNSTYPTSSAQDFINLFKYIKTNENSVFYGKPPIIIVTIAHSCSNNIGLSVCSPILSANPSYYDYMSPQIYTCNFGTTNEYLANNQLAWCPSWNSTPSTTSSFTQLLQENSTYATYGLNMLIPSINYPNLYTGSGSNTYSVPPYPNLYWYETDYTNTNQNSSLSSVSGANAPTCLSGGAGTINYTEDKGAVDFFTTMFDSSNNNLGGYIQWVNGSLTYPAPTETLPPTPNPTPTPTQFRGIYSMG